MTSIDLGEFQQAQTATAVATAPMFGQMNENCLLDGPGEVEWRLQSDARLDADSATTHARAKVGSVIPLLRQSVVWQTHLETMCPKAGCDCCSGRLRFTA